MPNVSDNVQRTAKADENHKIDPAITINTDTNNLAEIPVLAKDSYYLSRLERELARAVVFSKRESSKKDANKQSNNEKAEKELAKKRAQYDKIKNRSQQTVQARIDSIPQDLPAKLNLDLPVSQRAEDLIQAIIDNQVIIVAGETGSGKTTQLPKLAMLVEQSSKAKAYRDEVVSERELCVLDLYYAQFIAKDEIQNAWCQKAHGFLAH